MDLLRFITDPSSVYSRQNVLISPCPVPAAGGLYGWLFKQLPGSIPTEGCVRRDDLTLLYVGISPKNDRSSQNLRKRITYHYRGNAEGSTLRLTLGVLLAPETGFPLRRVGSGKRMTFTHLGEQYLDDWMERNAYVCWVEHPAPWEVEADVLRTLPLPLNIQHNWHHPFSGELSKLRTDAKLVAQQEPVAREDNQRRRM